jgi:hypothetical protein
MQDSTFVHDSSSSNRVPVMIQNIVRVLIEFPFLCSGMAFRSLHFLLVIELKQIRNKRKETTND